MMILQVSNASIDRHLSYNHIVSEAALSTFKASAFEPLLSRSVRLLVEPQNSSLSSVCTLCDKRIASRAKVYGHFRHYHHMHFDQCVQMLLADGFVMDPTVSTLWMRLRGGIFLVLRPFGVG